MFTEEDFSAPVHATDQASQTDTAAQAPGHVARSDSDPSQSDPVLPHIPPGPHKTVKIPVAAVIIAVTAIIVAGAVASLLIVKHYDCNRMTEAGAAEQAATTAALLTEATAAAPTAAATTVPPTTARVTTTAPTTAAVPVDLSTLRTGDLIEFGSYPQSEVKDNATQSGLNKLSLSWVSYGYYIDNAPSDFMKYADVTYGGNKFRAVQFADCRPGNTTYSGSADNSVQYANGYHIDTVYWFRYEPVIWRVLDPDEGLLMTEYLLDCQPFNNEFHEGGRGDLDSTDYAADWAYSSLRDWLNDEFCDTLFSVTEQGIIRETNLKTLSGVSSNYDSGPTTDRLFILSREDVLNSSYGFSGNEDDEETSGRTVHGTDYAKCQGLVVNNSEDKYGNGVSDWRLRTPFYPMRPGDMSATYYVSSNGRVDAHVYTICDGVRPALYIDLKSAVSQSLITAHQG